jgi:hypothetical protein
MRCQRATAIDLARPVETVGLQHGCHCGALETMAKRLQNVLDALPVTDLAEELEVRRTAAISPTLEEKLSWQKKQRELEGKRGKLRWELFERQDEVEVRRNESIGQLEAQLGQRVEERTLFMIEWELV